jgi:hypothetical protein
MRDFAKAVLFGTAVAAGPMLFFTVPIGILNFAYDLQPLNVLWASLWLAILPLAVAFPLVLSSSLLIGIPVSVTLRKMKRETSKLYVICGASFGFVVPIIILAIWRAPAGYWMSLLGALGGAATARSWAKSRSR